MAEEHKEATWVEKEETWVKKASQLLPSLASSLIAPKDFFRVSFEYPSLLAHSVEVKVG